MGRKTNPINPPISPDEINALITQTSETRYIYTLKRIADSEYLWTIVKDDKSFFVQNNGIDFFIPIWSAREYAILFCNTLGKEYRIVSISLDEFAENVIDVICAQQYLLNVFPTIKDCGKIVSVQIFAEDLSKFLNDYY